MLLLQNKFYFQVLFLSFQFPGFQVSFLRKKKGDQQENLYKIIYRLVSSIIYLFGYMFLLYGLLLLSYGLCKEYTCFSACSLGNWLELLIFLSTDLECTQIFNNFFKSYFLCFCGYHYFSSVCAIMHSISICCGKECEIS